MTGKQEKTLGQRIPGIKWQRLFLLLCSAILILSSCTHIPTEQELATEREKHARKDVELIKPAMKYGNFGEQALDLRQAIEYALENNLELRIAKLQEQIKNKETMVEKLRMLPSLRADGTWKRRDLLRKSDVYNWLVDEDQKDYTVSELKENSWANLVLTWNVLDTLMAYVRSNVSKMQEKILKQQRTRQAQNLALEVTRAYWHAAAVEDALDYVHVVEDRLKKTKREMERAVQSRSYDSMAAMDAEMRLRELEMTIRQLQTNLSKERLELARLMGLNQNVQFTLSRPPIKPLIAALPHTKELNIDRLEEYALLHRPELFVSDIQVLIQKEEAKNKVLAMFPGLSIFGGAHYEQNRLLYSNTWNSVGAAVSLELLDLPAKYVALKGQEKAIELAKTQRLLTTVGVITQVHIALLDYAIKVDRFRLLDQTYSLADNLFKMAQTKNQAGQLPALAVTQRHLEEMAAKLRRDEAVVDLMVAHKRLCVSIGVSPLDCDSTGMMGGGAASSVSAGSGYNYTESNTGLKKWKCTECGYIHTGTEPPETCPICGVGRQAFVEIGATGGSSSAIEPLNLDAGGTNDLSSWGATPMMKDDGATRSRGYAGPISDQFLWKVQLGAFSRPGGPAKRISEIKNLTDRILDSRDAVVTTTQQRGQLFNRVRVLGLTEPQAKLLARELASRGMEYWVIPPNSIHYQ